MEYEATGLSILSQSQGDKPISRFNEAMESMSTAITNPGHYKF